MSSCMPGTDIHEIKIFNGGSNPFWEWIWGRSKKYVTQESPIPFRMEASVHQDTYTSVQPVRSRTRVIWTQAIHQIQLSTQSLNSREFTPGNTRLKEMFI